jgi:hypothetical protein
MANKIIELTLKVNNAGTLDDMAQSARELEDALRAAGSGAEGFQKGMQALAGARSEMKEFRMDVKGITFDQQIAGAARFVNGFVSGFALMQTAMMAFGSEGSQSIEKVVKTLGLLMTAMTALQNIASAFDGETMKSLKLLGGQWTKLVGVVKNASMSMKAALISSGIGAILLILTAVIANWEKVVKFTKVALGLEKDRTAEAEKELAYQEKSVKLTEERAKIMQELFKLTGDVAGALKVEYETNKANVEMLENKLIVQQANVKKTEEEAKKVGFLADLWSQMVYQYSLGFAHKKAQLIVDNNLLKRAQEAQLAAEEYLNTNSEILVEKVKASKIEAELLSLASKHGTAQGEYLLTLEEANALLTKKGELTLKERLQLEDILKNAKDHKKNDEVGVANLKRKIDLLGVDKENEAEIATLKQTSLLFELNNKTSLIAISEQLLKNDQEQLNIQNEGQNSMKEELITMLQSLDASIKREDAEQAVKVMMLETNKQLRQSVEARQDIIDKLKTEAQVLQDQIDLIAEQERIRKRDQAIADFKMKREKTINEYLANQAITTEDIAQALEQQKIAMEEVYRITDMQTEQLKLQADQVELINTGFQDYLSGYDELNNAADIYAGKLDTFIGQSVELGGGIRITADAYVQLIDMVEKSNIMAGEQIASIDEINDGLSQSEMAWQNILEVQYKKLGAGDKDIERAAQQLAMEQIMSGVMIDQLETQKAQLMVERQSQQQTMEKQQTVVDNAEIVLQGKKDELTLEKSLVAGLIARGLKGRELRDAENASILKQKALELEILKLEGDKNNKVKDVNDTKKEITITDQKIWGIENNINTEMNKHVKNQQKIRDGLKDEMKMRDKIADWWDKNGEKVQGIADITMAGIELIGTAFQNQVNLLNQAYAQYMIDSQKGIDDISEQLDALKEKESDSKDRLDELNAMREDASASRLAEIDAEISAINSKTATEAESIAKLQKDKDDAMALQHKTELEYKNKIAQAEYKNAQWKKAQAIIEAVINGVLGVIKAAPNPVMMAVVGVLAAASVATIAAQKIPPPLVYKEKGGLIQGARHSQGGVKMEAEGGEWIAPRWMVTNRKTAPVIQELENIRVGRKKYADGGQVAAQQPALVAAQQSAMIDYDLLAEKLSGMNIWVSVAEIKDVDRKFTNTVYKGSSI